MDRPVIPDTEEALAALKTLRLWASEFFLVDSCLVTPDPECDSCRIIHSLGQLEQEMNAQLGIVPVPTVIGLTYADPSNEEVWDEETDEVEETFHLAEWAQWKGDGPMPKSWEAISPEGVTTKVYRSYQDYCND